MVSISPFYSLHAGVVINYFSLSLCLNILSILLAKRQLPNGFTDPFGRFILSGNSNLIPNSAACDDLKIEVAKALRAKK